MSRINFHAILLGKHSTQRKAAAGLELSFATRELRDICEKRSVAVSILGLSSALELEQRIADIEALENVSDLIELFPECVVQMGTGFSLQIEAAYKVVFCAGHVSTPLTSVGTVNWEKVTRIRIVALEATNA